MTYRIACQCGKGVFAEATDAGARLKCECGRVVVMPNLSVLRQMAPASRRLDNTPTKWPRPDTEADRNLNSAKLWFFGGAFLLVADYFLAQWAKRPQGSCIQLIGVGAVIVGVMRFVRGMFARKAEKQT